MAGTQNTEFNEGDYILQLKIVWQCAKHGKDKQTWYEALKPKRYEQLN